MFQRANNVNVVNIDEDLCDPKTFMQKLADERRRSERTGKPFAIMSLNFNILKEKKRSCKINELNRFKKVITKIVIKNCRATDIKAWVNENIFKIILLETSMVEAEKFKEKVLSKINEYVIEKKQKYKTCDIQEIINIIAYPDFLKKSGRYQKVKKNGNKMNEGSNREYINNNEQKEYDTLEWRCQDYNTTVQNLYSELENDWKKIDLFRMLKRIIDIVGAMIGALLFMPTMIVISISIKITSPGPIFFKQERVGYLGKKFILLKFRTMYEGCNEEKHKNYVKKLISKKLDVSGDNTKKNTIYKIDNDNRVTKVGRILRKSSLDELPQLYNVLRGDMSLVGPRPPITYEVCEYETWHLRRIMEVKPGITGLWQVKGRSRTTFDDMVRMDIMYVKENSIWLDLKIMFKTCIVVLIGKGAY